MQGSDIPFVEWEDFLRQFRWKQGEHVSLIGTTGSGKTTLGLELMKIRKYSVVFGTKPKDQTLTRMYRQGWKRIRTWEERPPMIAMGRQGPPPQRLILWPTYRTMDDVPQHKGIFRQALREMFTAGNWGTFLDETYYVTHPKMLGLERELTQYWIQGRSLGLSLVGATQRPAHVPLLMYSQATHLFAWRMTDRRDIERLRDVAGPVDKRAIMRAVSTLDFRRYEVLYVNTRTGEVCVTIPMIK